MAPSFRPVVARMAAPTVDQVTAALQAPILSGEAPAGSKLPSERELAEQLGVSRPVVREALRALSERGMVQIHPGRGAFVTAPGVLDSGRGLGWAAARRGVTPRDLIQVRGYLEAPAAGLAAERASHAGPALADVARRIDEAPDIVAQARLDLAFHAAVARLSGNPVIEVMFGSIATYVSEQALRSLGDPEVSRAGRAGHARIAAAIGAGDHEKAAQHMLAHVTLAEQLYGADLDRPLAAQVPAFAADVVGFAGLDALVDAVFEGQ